MDSLRNITEAEAYWRDAQIEFEVKRSEAKAAKEAAEAKLERLHEVIREETNQSKTLFSPSTRDAVRNDNGQAVPAGEDDSWRKMTLKALSLPKGLLKKLAEASPPIVTVGDYTDFMKPDEKTGWQKQLTDIKGLGEAAITKLQDAIDNFFAERQKAAADVKVPLVEGETTLTDGSARPVCLKCFCQLGDDGTCANCKDGGDPLDAEIDAAEPTDEN